MNHNRLGAETSPYLLQHRDNPVHWWAWSEDALAEAQRRDVPVLLSVGYAACHWCHVMAHESFEHAETAALMNAHFVNIKVDREERPDVDAIYMAALHALGEQGGWPLTMFLTPNARPFWGGTYFPLEERFGRPSFRRVLAEIARIYREDPEKVGKNASALVAHLRAERPLEPVGKVSDDILKDLAIRLSGAVDPERGGLSGAPKFPQFSVFWFLWRAGLRYGLDDARSAVIRTLRNICQGGIYDHIGSGFARYSVDERWLVPHFEKMLYDNALLLQLLTEAWKETQDPLFAQRSRETIDWVFRDMLTPEGAFAASYDADSEGEEGKFAVWTPAEVEAVLGTEDGALFCRLYDITEAGNFEGKSIPNRLAKLALEDVETEQRLIGMRAKLLEARRTRVPPGFDDKVLTDWNGLMIVALVRVAFAFDDKRLLEKAGKVYAAVKRLLLQHGRFRHAWRVGIAKAPATAADLANMIAAAIELHQATGESIFLDDAVAWSAVLDRHYWVADAGGYAFTADDTADLIVRTRTAGDDATPNANGTQTGNLIALSVLTGDLEFLARAEATAGAFLGDALTLPVGHLGLLAAVIDMLAPLQIALIREQGGTNAGLLDRLRTISVPGAVVQRLADTSTVAAGSPLFGKTAIGGGETAYVCSGPECSLPVTDANAFSSLLAAQRQRHG